MALSSQQDLELLENDSEPHDHSKTLSSGVYTTNAFARLKTLRENSSFCDLVLKADDVILNVHKAVMVACSEYFRTMFMSNFMESKQEMVELKGISGTGLRAMVSFAYSGDLELDQQNVSDILSAASHFQSEEAIQLCAEYFRQCITTENCKDILNLAELYSLEPVKDLAMKFMLQSFESLAQCDQYYKLSHLELAQLVESNSLRVSSEYRLFEHVMKWINYDKESRKQYAPMLINRVRLALIPSQQLVEKVSSIDLMNENPECNSLLIAAKDYQLLSHQQPLMQCRTTSVRAAEATFLSLDRRHLKGISVHGDRVISLQDCPSQVFRPCMIDMKNFLYVLGGRMGEHAVKATPYCFRYDPRFNTWMQLPHMNHARADFSVVVKDSHIYCIGGINEGRVLRYVERYSLVENSWEARTDLPEPRHCLAAGAHPNSEKIYVCGGILPNGALSSVLYGYTPQTDTWETITQMPVPRANHAIHVHENGFQVFGGMRVSAPHKFDSYLYSSKLWSRSRWPYPGTIIGPFTYDNKFFFIRKTTNDDILFEMSEQISLITMVRKDGKYQRSEHRYTQEFTSNTSFGMLVIPTSM
jgi:hypothetical protein